MSKVSGNSSNTGTQSLAARLVVPVCCIVVAVLCSAHLDQMFLDGHLGFAGSLRGVIGSNYLRYDPVETRFAPLQNAGPSFDAAPSVRFNHPPLSGMLVGLAFALAGPSEATARIVPIAASILTVPLLFGWVRRLWGKAAAITAVIIWSLSPFVVIYGAMVSYEPLVMLSWNLLLWAWARWSLGESPRMALTWAGLALFAGVWTDWPMVPLAGGLLVTEGLLVAFRRPRRPAMLLVLVSCLAGALGALAIYYFVVLDIDGERLESLYRIRSSLGRWSATDVAVHIAHRTAVLLTWPLVITAAVGLGSLALGRPRSEGHLSGPSRALVFIGLLAPPLALLVVLSQHAVIHCFSAWYLLPAAVVGSAVTLVWLSRLLHRRSGRLASAAPAVLFTVLFLWGATPVVLDGWLSDGSPLEGRPRLHYTHLAIARWAGENTRAGDILVIDDATGITGVRTWFRHGRAVSRVRRAASVTRALREHNGRLALAPATRFTNDELRRLASDHGLTFIGGTLAVDAGRRREVSVLEIREERITPWWVYAGSASYPPHRLIEAPGRTAVYREQLLGERSPTIPVVETDDMSIAELAARHLITGDEERRDELARAIEERLTFSAPERARRPGRGLLWRGGRLEMTPQGLPMLSLVFQTEEGLRRPPTIRAFLEPEDGSRGHQWIAAPDDLFVWPADSWIVSTRRLPASLLSGPYRLEIRVGRRRFQVSVNLERQLVLPMMDPVGRL